MTRTNVENDDNLSHGQCVGERVEIGGGGEESGRNGGQREGQQRRDNVDNVSNPEQEQQPGGSNYKLTLT